MLRRSFLQLFTVNLLAGVSCILSANEVWAEDVTTPKEEFGFSLGDDYCLANHQQMKAYWQKLERESKRMKLEVIGKSEEGRDILMAIITSPKNHRKLERYRQISRRLALAEGLDDAEARELASEGKAVVWIDGGLHASEVLVAQQLMETAYQMVSRDDAEMQRFLDDVVTLLCCPNPDGLDLVADWYMREDDPKKRSSRSLPRLYQKYIGHDNNRDFYMATQKESQAVCGVFYHQWHPQIVYNHHQSGPSGTVMFAPPFRDPFNHNFDALVPVGIDLVGASMHNRFIVEGKPGVTMCSGASYSTWWNGGLRTSVYFHNMIGLLTETIGHPTPMTIPLRVERQLATADMPLPISPQKWHFRQSVEYSLTANWAVLDVASRHREQFLFNAFRMGKNSIERGSRDHWTIRPKRIDIAQAADRSQNDSSSEGKQGPRDLFAEVLHDPAHRDPRGFILPSDQADFLTATKFVNALIMNGVTVHCATSWFEVNGKTYPAGSYVVKTDQAFRPHVVDMFEPQDHPNDIPYPGGPPKAPYDNAGWTLAFQMGVQFDRVLDGFSGPFERIEGFAKAPATVAPQPDTASGYLVDRTINDSFLAVNRLLRQGAAVYCVQGSFEHDGQLFTRGDWYIPNRPEVRSALAECAQLGLPLVAVSDAPEAAMAKVRPVRVGLWDRYGGSMASGWTRWLLEQFEFDFKVVYPPELDKGSLEDRFDVLVFADGAIPTSFSSRTSMPDKERIPKEYHDRVGGMSADKTLASIRAFVEQGGVALSIGSSTALARHLDVPIRNALARTGKNGGVEPLGREEFYIPGSVVRVRVDNQHDLALGMPEEVDVMFRRSPAFRLPPEAIVAGVRPAAWFASEDPLRSGWAWGQHHLKDSAAIVEAPVGEGVLYLYGPEVAFRAQPHGSFKFLFNGIYNPRSLVEAKP